MIRNLRDVNDERPPSMDLLLAFLDTQDYKAVVKDHWDPCTYILEESKQRDGGTDVLLKGVEIGFAFDKEGRFIGIFNWAG